MHIKANCTGAENLDISEFNELQGDLKSISREALDKLRTSILTYGIIYPFHAWRDKTGKVWIVDAHQRTKAVRELLEAGHTCDKIPTTFIEAKSKKDAAEKLLILNSKYAKITEDGLENFVFENELDLTSLDDMLDIDIEISEIAEAMEKVDKIEDNEELKLPQSVQVEPPKEYILIMAEPNSVEWEDLRDKLKLKMVRKGGYKKGSPLDEIGIERVLTWADFKERYADSNTE